MCSAQLVDYLKTIVVQLLYVFMGLIRSRSAQTTFRLWHVTVWHETTFRGEKRIYTWLDLVAGRDYNGRHVTGSYDDHIHSETGRPG